MIATTTQATTTSFETASQQESDNGHSSESDNESSYSTPAAALKGKGKSTGHQEDLHFLLKKLDSLQDYIVQMNSSLQHQIDEMKVSPPRKVAKKDNANQSLPSTVNSNNNNNNNTPTTTTNNIVNNTVAAVATSTFNIPTATSTSSNTSEAIPPTTATAENEMQQVVEDAEMQIVDEDLETTLQENLKKAICSAVVKYMAKLPVDTRVPTAQVSKLLKEIDSDYYTDIDGKARKLSGFIVNYVVPNITQKYEEHTTLAKRVLEVSGMTAERWAKFPKDQRTLLRGWGKPTEWETLMETTGMSDIDLNDIGVKYLNQLVQSQSAKAQDATGSTNKPQNTNPNPNPNPNP